MNDRRRFITLVPFAGAALLAACSKESAPPPPVAAPAPAVAAAPAAEASAALASPATTAANLPLVDESSPIAVSLGYVAVSSRADAAKYKTHTASQACANCALYAGKEGAAQGPCPLFAGSHVKATGWCSAYAKKG